MARPLWRGFGASVALIDYALIVPFVILYLAFSPTTITTNVNGVTSSTESGGRTSVALLMYVIGLAIWAFNRWYKGGQGQTFGKKTLGLLLVAESTGQPIGWNRACLRDFAHIADAIPGFVGYLFPLWDQKHQIFADKIMTTVVITKAHR